MRDLDKFRREHAIYTPAISPAFCKPLSLEKNADLAADMNWLNEDSPWHYPWSLYSAGHAFMDIPTSDERESYVQKRNRDDSFIIGDSGGFQIATNKMNFDWDNFESVHDPDNKKITRIQLLRWLEHTSDCATTLDFPTWIHAPNSGRGDDANPYIDSMDKCLAGTIENLKFFEKHRDPESGCRFLNVLQGVEQEDTDEWYQAVKNFNFEGWAIAGTTRLELAKGLPRLLKIRDDHLFEGERDWVHVLGVSKLSAGLALTALQKAMRKHINPKIQFSYDSASPFLMAAFGSSYYNYIMSDKKLSMQAAKTPKSKDLIGYEGQWPWNSPINDKYTIGEFVDPEAKHTWTLRGYLFQMYNNTYQICNALQEAQHTYLLPGGDLESFVMKDTLELEQVLEEVFTSETPHDVIHKHQTLLNNAISKSLGDTFPGPNTEIGSHFAVQVSNLEPSDQNKVDDAVEKDGGSSDTADSMIMNFMREQKND